MIYELHILTEKPLHFTPLSDPFTHRHLPSYHAPKQSALSRATKSYLALHQLFKGPRPGAQDWQWQLWHGVCCKMAARTSQCSCHKASRWPAQTLSVSVRPFVQLLPSCPHSCIFFWWMHLTTAAAKDKKTMYMSKTKPLVSLKSGLPRTCVKKHAATNKFHNRNQCVY